MNYELLIYLKLLVMNILNFLNEKHKATTANAYFEEWLDFENFCNNLTINILEVDYKLLLTYVEHLKQRKLKAVSINRKLMVLEKIYSHLLPFQNNPTKGFRVKAEGRKPIQEPLEVADLQEILNNLPTENIYQKRNHLILSFIHYQALRCNEIKALEIQDIDFKNALLHVPKVGRNNSRNLELNALQIVEIQNYTYETRPQLLQSESTKLFITGGNADTLTNTLAKFQKQLKKQVLRLQNLAHWRSSIIVHWLEHQPLLEVQAKIGHRYASSTEQYKIHAVKNLQQHLHLHHPLR